MVKLWCGAGSNKDSGLERMRTPPRSIAAIMILQTPQWSLRIHRDKTYIKFMSEIYIQDELLYHCKCRR